MVAGAPWCVTSAIDGSKNIARNTPEMRSTTNENSAISPSMKDQWSGKTLRTSCLASTPTLVRWSR